MDEVRRSGMCNLLLPNCMFLVCVRVRSNPSLKKLSLSLVRKWCLGVLREAGKMEPARAKVKNRRRPQAYTVRCRDEKDGDN